MSSRGGSRSGSGRKLLSPRSRLASKEKSKGTKKRWEEQQKNSILLQMFMQAGRRSNVCAFIRLIQPSHNIFYPSRCDEERGRCNALFLRSSSCGILSFRT